MARIGVITTSYPRFAGDHAGSFVGAHVRALEAMGHECDVVHATQSDTLFYRGGAPDAIERLGVRALPAAASFTARLTAQVAARSRGRGSNAQRGSNARGWDAAIAHWLAPSAIAAAAALPRHVPLLAIAHGGDVHTLRRTNLLGVVLRALRVRGATLAVVSNELRLLCAPYIEAIVQPMGIDVAHFAALGRAPTSPPTVAVIGRLVPVKGIDVAIRALDHITRPVRLVIAGDGPLRAALARMNDRAELLGEIDAARRDRLLREASVVVVPSRILMNGRSEGVPLVALEALAAGVPVIASRVGGLAELPVMHVPPDDPHALATAIEAVLASPPPRQAMAAFDWREVAARLLPMLPA